MATKLASPKPLAGVMHGVHVHAVHSEHKQTPIKATGPNGTVRTKLALVHRLGVTFLPIDANGDEMGAAQTWFPEGKDALALLTHTDLDSIATRAEALLVAMLNASPEASADAAIAPTEPPRPPAPDPEAPPNEGGKVVTHGEPGEAPKVEVARHSAGVRVGL